MSSVNVAHCGAELIVYFGDEEKKDGPEYESYKLIGHHFGTFEDHDHERFDDGDIALMDFKEDVKFRIGKGVDVHAAYHESSQHDPKTAEELVMGWESIRNMAYRHAREDGTAMPFDPALVGKYLEDRDLDGNLYEQIIKRGLYDKNEIKPEVDHAFVYLLIQILMFIINNNIGTKGLGGKKRQILFR